jgi:hypothetical protein
MIGVLVTPVGSTEDPAAKRASHFPHGLQDPLSGGILPQNEISVQREEEDPVGQFPALRLIGN